MASSKRFSLLDWSNQITNCFYSIEKSRIKNNFNLRMTIWHEKFSIESYECKSGNVYENKAYYKVLAAPQPPGIMRATWPLGLQSVSGLIEARAIRAPSTNAFRNSTGSYRSVVRWLTDPQMVTSGAKNRGTIPCSLMWIANDIASDISEPSSAPQPHTTCAHKSITLNTAARGHGSTRMH